MKFRLPFSGVGAKYTDREKKIVIDAMESNDTLTQGNYQAKFEDDFSKFIGVKYCFATSCAASALELAALVIKIKSGDEIICPAHTYNASAYPFAKHGGKLVWADINKDTWVCDVDTLDSVVNENTRAIVVVHLYGAPANMPEIVSYAKRKNLILIEDCAQAIGASINDKPVGSFGDISIFSFHSHKNISTLGEGGMICTNNIDYARLIPGLRHNGHAPYVGRDPRYYWLPAMSNVDVDIEGVWPNNFCIGEVQCALGSTMLPRIAEINKVRRKRFFEFEAAVREIREIAVQKFYPSALSTHHLLPIMFSGNPVTRDVIIEKLAYEYSIQAIVQYYPLYRYPLFSKNGFGKADVPNTDKFFDNMISLPFHQWMSDEDFKYLVESTIDCINKTVKRRI